MVVPRGWGGLGCPALSGRDHGGSWGGGLGGLGCLNGRDPTAVPGERLGAVEGRLCVFAWVASLLFLLVRPPCPGQPQEGAEASPLMYLRVLVPVGHVSPSPAPPQQSVPGSLLQTPSRGSACGLCEG